MSEKNEMKRGTIVKKIAYISGTRADFGLMMPILRAVRKSKKLSLQIYATGIHLMPEFGATVNEVRQEFSDARQIKAVFRGDDRDSVAKFTGEFLRKLVVVLQKDKPDFVLTLGDRPEMLCVATACLYLSIPTGQVHGGEKTFTVDEVARHAITKLSHVHFAATQESARRIQKMGEEKNRIYVVGAPALDVILNEKLPTCEELCAFLGLEPREKFILLTQHPVSEEYEEAGRQMKKSIAAIKTFGLPVVVIYPHADAGGRRIIEVIEREKNNPLFRIFPSLSHKQFLALEREAAVWVGNSSGAMIESVSFRTPVVNVGARQRGRQHGDNVIDVGYDREEIRRAIKKSLNNKAYKRRLAKIKNPWGDGQTGKRVVKILEELSLKRLLVKQITY